MGVDDRDNCLEEIRSPRHPREDTEAAAIPTRRTVLLAGQPETLPGFAAALPMLVGVDYWRLIDVTLAGANIALW